MIPFSSDEIDPNSPQKDLIGTCHVTSNNFYVQNVGNPFEGNMTLGLFPNLLEVDISGLEGTSKIRFTFYDNCSIGCTQANLYEGNNIIKTVSNKTVQVSEDFVFDISSNTTKVRIWSFEGFLYRITVE